MQSKKLQQEAEMLQDAQNNFFEWDENECSKKLKENEENMEALLRKRMILIEKIVY